MRTIPKRLLCHTAILYETSTADSWNDAPETPITLMLVRVDAKLSAKTGSSATDHSLKGTLFFDATHSTPKGQKFVPEQRIEWNGHTGTISDVAYLYEHNKLHHIEVAIK